MGVKNWYASGAEVKYTNVAISPPLKWLHCVGRNVKLASSAVSFFSEKQQVV